MMVLGQRYAAREAGTCTRHEQKNCMGQTRLVHVGQHNGSRHTIQSFPQRSRVFPVACEVDRCRATVDSQMRLDAVNIHAVSAHSIDAVRGVTSLTLLHLVTAV